MYLDRVGWSDQVALVHFLLLLTKEMKTENDKRCPGYATQILFSKVDLEVVSSTAWIVAFNGY